VLKRLLPLPGSEHAGARHVPALGRWQQPRVDVAVDGLLVDGEAVRVVGHDVVDGLAVAHKWAEDVGDHGEGFFGDVGPLARLHELFPVVRMREPMNVIALPQHAGMLLLAAVADVRRGVQTCADAFNEIRAASVAQMAGGAPAHAVGIIHAELDLIARFLAFATVCDAVRRTLVAGLATGPYLPADGLQRLADVAGDLPEGLAMA